jgi:hypothetical protein
MVQRRSVVERVGGDPQPANELVEITELTAQEEIDERDSAGVQGLQVDPGAKHTAAGILRMGHDATAQHPDANVPIQQRQIDRRLHVVDEPIVLGVEALAIVHRHVGGAVASLDRHAPKIQRRVSSKRVEQL